MGKEIVTHGPWERLLLCTECGMLTDRYLLPAFEHELIWIEKLCSRCGNARVMGWRIVTARKKETTTWWRRLFLRSPSVEWELKKRAS